MRKSIRYRLTVIGILPLVLLGVSIFVFGVALIYAMNAESIRDELETSTYILKGCFDLTVRGDYTYEQDTLKKGDINISDSTMLYEIKNNSDVDTTIFWGDTRVLTTVENSFGVSAVGTKASSEVIKQVLDNGNDYFSNNLIIGDRSYIGYYTPLINENNTVVGMIFAGKPTISVYQRIAKVMMVFLLVTLVVIFCSLIVWKRYTKNLITDIEEINTYFQSIANGDLNAVLERSVVQREDEIGRIGRYATKMCEELKIMVERDPLTLLYNRRTCNYMLKKLAENQSQFVVVMSDIDWFKKINDHYGHACGDYILKSVSAIIADSVKDCGFASRWGGEEFLLIYELDYEVARKKVEALSAAIRDTAYEYEGQTIHLTMTIGVKNMDWNESYEKAIKAADDKLYIGKRNGRNQIVY